MNLAIINQLKDEGAACVYEKPIALDHLRRIYDEAGIVSHIDWVSSPSY
jgi:hypothetical protein